MLLCELYRTVLKSSKKNPEKNIDLVFDPAIFLIYHKSLSNIVSFFIHWEEIYSKEISLDKVTDGRKSKH